MKFIGLIFLRGCKSYNSQRDLGTTITIKKNLKHNFAFCHKLKAKWFNRNNASKTHYELLYPNIV